jgi:hypothetical protein
MMHSRHEIGKRLGLRCHVSHPEKEGGSFDANSSATLGQEDRLNVCPGRAWRGCQHWVWSAGLAVPYARILFPCEVGLDLMVSAEVGGRVAPVCDRQATPIAFTTSQHLSALPQAFFCRPGEQVAPELIGCLLVKRQPTGELLWGVIVETEAYSQDDPACHGYRRRTPSNETLFGEPGRFYVYVGYGIHHCVKGVISPANQFLAPGYEAAVACIDSVQLAFPHLCAVASDIPHASATSR